MYIALRQCNHTDYLCLRGTRPSLFQWNLKFIRQPALHSESLYTWCAPCPAHLFLLDWITQTKLGEEWEFSRSPYTVFSVSLSRHLLCPNIIVGCFINLCSPIVLTLFLLLTRKPWTLILKKLHRNFCSSYNASDVFRRFSVRVPAGIASNIVGTSVVFLNS
jgi:hypothetical protein